MVTVKRRRLSATVDAPGLQNGILSLPRDWFSGLERPGTLTARVEGNVVGSLPFGPGAGGDTVAIVLEHGLRALPPFDILFEFDGAPLAVRFPVASEDAVLTGLGAGRIVAELAGFTGTAISFALDVPHASSIGRAMILRVAGRSVAEAVSTPAAGDRQEIRFPLPALPEAGTEIQLQDLRSGRILHDGTLDALVLLKLMAEAQGRVEARLAAMEEERKRLLALVESQNVASRERQMVERLDLFYALMQERLDRDMAAVMARLEPPGRVAAETAALAPETPIDPAALEGLGFYDLEGEGEAVWRWFGPRVTLVLRDTDPAARLIQLAFWRIAPDVGPGTLSASVDGERATVTFRREGEGGQVVVEIPPAAIKPGDRPATRILNLSFGAALPQPDNGDRRLLAAVFSRGTVAR